ncbi:MAG: methyl-coenzyme M reductase operon protein D [Methanospirillum sp.]|nr:methyl-coenzyme M reductase operon protein D [Methanospirillum sp.]
MTDATYPQVRVAPARLLNPETVEQLLNLLAAIEGIRKIVLKGQSIPAEVPYGPARGKPNPHPMHRTITVLGDEVELQTHVGIIDMELVTDEALPAIREACDTVFTRFPYSVQEGRFMKTQATVSDYAKYGPNADEILLGLVDPKSRRGPVILQGSG